MPLELKFTCQLPNGVHARPAGALEEVARDFGAEIILVNERTGRSVNSKSILAIVGADIRQHDPCHFKISGPDAEDAQTALATFLRDKFPHCDDALPIIPLLGDQQLLPPALRDSQATIRRGTPVVGGIGRGVILQIGGLRLPKSLSTNGVKDLPAEIRKLDGGLNALVAGYEDRLARHAARVEMEVLKAHRSVARDPEFRGRLHEALRRDGLTVAGAVLETEEHFSSMLIASESAMLRERALDVQDVCFQLLRQVYGKLAVTAEVQLVGDAIVVAETLTPGQFLALDRRWLKGLVLGQAGTTSHTVILARSFGIPTLTGVAELAGAKLQGQAAVVDADSGLLLTDLTEPARRYYAMEERRLEGRHMRQRRFAMQPAMTPDGYRLEIAANIATAEEAVPAFDAGAEGIGLFRTEMLFFDRDEAPGEEEQFEKYCQTLAAARDRPVIIRLLDIGGDKPLAYLELPAEDNPFLGYRAVRIYPEFEKLIRTQIRALIRASAHGRLKVMIPMITTLEEVRWVKQLISMEQAGCTAAGINFDPAMQVGVMVEVPAAAFILDLLNREVDFFSIGSNDLLQCFAAADRNHPRLTRLYDPLQPAFLRLLKKIVDEIHSGNKWVGLCGEMGGQIGCLPFLVGLGLEEISTAPSGVAALKAELALWPLKVCRELLQRALACETADEVRGLLVESVTQRHLPLIDPELVLIESNGTTKEEALKEVVDRLYVLGRTEQPRAIEEAVWQREAVYSTGFGHGFAIPHCKTNAVKVNSLAILKLRHPVPWGSLDGQPVHTVFLLVMREAEQANGHMKVFSRLARKVMHEEFRERLMREQDPDALCAFLEDTLSS